MVAVALAEVSDPDGAQSVTSTNAPGLNSAISSVNASTSSLQSG